MKNAIFWDITPCNPLKVGFPPVFTLVSYSAYSTIKIRAMCFFEAPVDSLWTTQRYIPEGRILPANLLPSVMPTAFVLICVV
jgi:hypothetical protein